MMFSEGQEEPSLPNTEELIIYKSLFVRKRKIARISKLEPEWTLNISKYTEG